MINDLDVVVKIYKYLYNEYTNFADQLVNLLIEALPWFKEFLNIFRAVAPVIKSSSGLLIYTLQANTLPAFVYGNIKKIKGEVPVSAITPVMEHIRRSIPVLIEYESLGLLMDYVFFVSLSNFVSELPSYKKIKKVFTKEKERTKLMKRLKEVINTINNCIGRIKQTELVKSIPELEDIKVEVKGSIFFEKSGLDLPIFSVDCPEPFYPQKFGLRVGYIVVSKANKYVEMINEALLSGNTEHLDEICCFLGSCCYARAFIDIFKEIVVKWGGMAIREGLHRTIKEINKDYEKLAKKDVVKIKDLRNFLTHVSILIS